MEQIQLDEVLLIEAQICNMRPLICLAHKKKNKYPRVQRWLPFAGSEYVYYPKLRYNIVRLVACFTPTTTLMGDMLLYELHEDGIDHVPLSLELRGSVLVVNRGNKNDE